MGRLGFDEGCIGKLGICTSQQLLFQLPSVFLEMQKQSLLVPLVLNSAAVSICSRFLPVTSEKSEFAYCIRLQQFLIFSRTAILVERPGARVSGACVGVR